MPVPVGARTLVCSALVFAVDPANESPYVLQGNWSPDGTMDNPGIEAYEGTMF